MTVQVDKIDTIEDSLLLMKSTIIINEALSCEKDYFSTLVIDLIMIQG